MDSSSKFFFSFSVNYVMIVKLVDLIVLLRSKLLNRFRKIFNRKLQKVLYPGCWQGVESADIIAIKLIRRGMKS